MNNKEKVTTYRFQMSLTCDRCDKEFRPKQSIFSMIVCSEHGHIAKCFCQDCFRSPAITRADSYYPEFLATRLRDQNEHKKRAKAGFYRHSV